MDESVSLHLKKEFIEEETDVKRLFSRLKRRDFSGVTGKAIHNGVYEIATNLVAKVGSLFFTILLARILLPELFGLYSLALSTILVFVSLSNFGLWETLVRFVSRELAKRKTAKAKSYFMYLAKLKIVLVFVALLALGVLSKFLAEAYYQKPLFFALLAGLLYILFLGLVGLFRRAFHALNQFRITFLQEVVFQVARLVLVPTLALYALKNLLGDATVLGYIIFGLSVAYLFSFAVLFFNKKKITFLSEKHTPLNQKEKKELNKFLLAISATAISGTFFSNIDTLMLGKFVGASFIGYYAAAFNILIASVALISLSAALLPIFSGLDKKQLERFFQKSLRLTLMFSLLLFFAFELFAPLIIQLVYGATYAPSITLLRVFSTLLLILPAIGIFSTYLTSVGRPFEVTKTLIVATVINILGNYIFISWLVRYSELHAVYGAMFATILSHCVYLGLLLFFKKRNALSSFETKKETTIPKIE